MKWNIALAAITLFLLIAFASARLTEYVSQASAISEQLARRIGADPQKTFSALLDIMKDIDERQTTVFCGILAFLFALNAARIVADVVRARRATNVRMS